MTPIDFIVCAILFSVFVQLILPIVLSAAWLIVAFCRICIRLVRETKLSALQPASS